MFELTLFLLIALMLFIGYVISLCKLFEMQAYVLLLIIASSPFLAYEAFQYYWFSKVLPAQISVTYPISISDEGGFREGCGSAIYKVSDETLEAIKKDGIKFFAKSTQARGYPNDTYYAYEEWRETPVPPSWTSEGSWILCSSLSQKTHGKIVAAAKQRGAYYTTKREGELILIPSLGYVIFSFFG